LPKIKRWEGIYEITSEEFKIIILKKPNELQEDTVRQLNDAREMIHEQN
jgi:hypothetical protein